MERSKGGFTKPKPRPYHSQLGLNQVHSHRFQEGGGAGLYLYIFKYFLLIQILDCDHNFSNINEDIDDFNDTDMNQVVDSTKEDDVDDDAKVDDLEDPEILNEEIEQLDEENKVLVNFVVNIFETFSKISMAEN